MGILTGLIPIPFAVLLMKRDIKCRALDGGEPKKTGVLSWVAIFFGFAGYCLFFNFFVTITRLREMFPSFDESAAADYENPPIFVYLGSAILAPIVEELIFRGLTFKRARSLTSFFPAALISGVIFGIAHMNILQGIYTCIMGLTLCYIFEKKQTILAPIIGHFGVNSIGILTTYVLPESFYTFEGVLTITLVSGAICIICFGFLFAKFHKLPAWQIKNLVE
jgi:membrane protease YdiL (CAAX protease family)